MAVAAGGSHAGPVSGAVSQGSFAVGRHREPCVGYVLDISRERRTAPGLSTPTR